MLVFVHPHPLIKHWVSVLRNEETPSPIFSSSLFVFLVAGFREIQSPMGPASIEFIDSREPIAVIPILRAGLALAEHASSVLPAKKIYHLGVSRDEETLQPLVYLNKITSVEI